MTATDKILSEIDFEKDIALLGWTHNSREPSTKAYRQLAALSREQQKAIAYILEYGTCFIGAIEGDGFNGDFEEWEKGARELLAAFPESLKEKTA